mgnify:CR=1 FL=1
MKTGFYYDKRKFQYKRESASILGQWNHTVSIKLTGTILKAPEFKTEFDKFILAVGEILKTKQKRQVRPKIAYRTYYCGICGTTSEQQTNHTGEIYVACSKCGNDVLYCKTQKFSKTYENAELVYYSFDISQDSERAAYEILTRQLQAEYKYEKFTCIMPKQSIYMNYISKIQYRTIKLFEEVCAGQFVSDIGRLHNWYEAVYPNDFIKIGYYLNHSGERKSK